MPLSELEYLHTLENMAHHINTSIAKSVLEITTLPAHILNLEGMSSNGNRILLNNMCAIKGNYLEIGSWKGSTFISALHNNTECFGTSIDNHQEFKNSIFKTSADELALNCKNNLTHNEKYELITNNCFSDTLNLTKIYDVYFYDGFHTYEDQYKAITVFYKNVNDIFIYICDDYSIDRVEKGTKDAFRDMNIQVIADYKLFGNQLIPACTKRGFWNGFYVALCVKKDKFPEFFNPKKYAHCFDSN
jgi:hypothetical protein